MLIGLTLHAMLPVLSGIWMRRVLVATVMIGVAIVAMPSSKVRSEQRLCVSLIAFISLLYALVLRT